MPPKKRIKVQDQDDDEVLLETVWDHYRSFLDSCDPDGEGDVDELHEIVQLLLPRNPSPTSTIGTTRQSLLPILLSMSYYQIASDLIAQSIDTDHHDKDNDDILHHLQASLRFFPLNCSTWSMGANYARIQNAVPPAIVVKWYQKAALYSSSLRTQTLELLDQDLEDESVKEWLELLVLNGMLGVEYELNEDNDNEEQGNSVDENELGHFSSSAVEATSRFMSAMLYSSLGMHDECLKQLEYFDLTHRLHPRVWQQTTEPAICPGPTLFHGGVLPPPLYQAMCQTFSPEAVYWKESDYSHRGYHSYFFDFGSEPSNLIEEVVVNHLLPLAKRCYTGTEEIVGAEWWPHHRLIQANLGHNLHFDTDEALLKQDGIISHPALSSVLYLTTGGNASSGPTIVLDQTPDSNEVATRCWSCTPQDNALMIFDGSLLHGVLPCPVKQEKDIHFGEFDTLTWPKRDRRKPMPHRLTFMVGFWTRSVPEKIKHRQIYGPCGELPPASSNEWVQHISVYPKGLPPSTKLKDSSLPIITPAWEMIDQSQRDVLPIPNRINHRFFVKGAPQCFRSSLFEDYDDDDL